MKRSLLVAALLAVSPLEYAEAEGMDAEVKALEKIGFQQFQDVSRVFVRTTEPVKYRLDTSRPDAVVLILENTRVPLKNNTRPLDTRYFESAVRYIRPKVIEGPSPSVHIEILMRQKVPFQEQQKDNHLFLDFVRQ